MNSPLIFALPDYSSLLSRACGGREASAPARCEVARFTNGELYLRLGSPVADCVCALLGSLAPPDEQMLSVLLLAHTLRREGARRVIALLPYLGYARQDRADPRQSLGVAWVGDLLGAAGVDGVLTIDVHSRQAAACFPMPLRSLSPARLFAEVLARGGAHDLTVVAPDEGALDRSRAVLDAAGIDRPLAYMRKHRDVDGIAHSAVVGAITRRVAIVDDILDTGNTLISACGELRRAGAQEITVFATHGLFSGERWRELQALGVERIYTTDSVPGARERGGEIVAVLPVGGLIIDAFMDFAEHLAERGDNTVHTTQPSIVERIEGPAPAEDSSVP